MQKRFAILFMPALVAGCYTYTPIEASQVTPGMQVRARVTANTADRLSSSLGGEQRVMSGVVTGKQGGGLTIEVPTVPMGNVNAQQGLYQQIALAPSDVLELESKTINRQRTGLLIGAGVVAVGIAAATLASGRSSGADAVPPDQGEFLIGLLRLHF